MGFFLPYYFSIDATIKRLALSAMRWRRIDDRRLHRSTIM
jgi:hypothetical protein